MALYLLNIRLPAVSFAYQSNVFGGDTVVYGLLLLEPFGQLLLGEIIGFVPLAINGTLEAI